MSSTTSALRRSLRSFIPGRLLFTAFAFGLIVSSAAADDIPDVGDELKPQLPEGSDAAISLACVTAGIDRSGGVQITNQRNVAIADPSEVFRSQAGAFGNLHLNCKDSWAATGCSAGRDTAGYPGAIGGEALKTTTNGCELIGSAKAPKLYLNCCSVASSMDPDKNIGVELIPTTSSVTSLPATANGRLGLACVTASVTGNSDETVEITSQRNIKLDSWRDAFTFDPYKGGSDSWGLICNDDWVFTGCTGSTTLLPKIPAGDPDAGLDKFHTPEIVSGFNGCRTDNEELWASAKLFATCCKLRLVGADGGD